MQREERKSACRRHRAKLGGKKDRGLDDEAERRALPAILPLSNKTADRHFETLRHAPDRQGFV